MQIKLEEVKQYAFEHLIASDSRNNCMLVCQVNLAEQSLLYRVQSKNQNVTTSTWYSNLEFAVEGFNKRVGDTDDK